jgi:hypothetical protein
MQARHSDRSNILFLVMIILSISLNMSCNFIFQHLQSAAFLNGIFSHRAMAMPRHLKIATCKT